MTTINDLLRRVPMLTVLPLLVWLFGMTAWISSWKAETDYKLAKMLEASAGIDEQSVRVVAIEQKLIHLTEYVREMKDTLKEKSK